MVKGYQQGDFKKECSKTNKILLKMMIENENLKIEKEQAIK